MTVKIPLIEAWLNPNTNKWEYVQKNMHQLIINNVEKYRLIINNQLIYAKGKINLVFYDDNEKDGNGVHLSEYQSTWWPYRGVKYSDIYAFYQDGFYRSSDLKKFDWNDLDALIPDFHLINKWPAKFKGWYTSKKGGLRINTIGDIFLYTNLFKYKEKNNLPEITLYAQWEWAFFTIRVHNIKRKQASSSCLYKGKTNTSYIIDTFKVIYGTDIIAYINERITNLKYVTWANNALDGTSNQQALRAGPQKFLGWLSVEDPYIFHGSSLTLPDKMFAKEYAFRKPDGSFITDESEERDRICDIYPVFEFLIIWKKVQTIKSKTILGGYFKTYSPSPESEYNNLNSYLRKDGPTGENLYFNDRDPVNKTNTFYNEKPINWDYMTPEWPIKPASTGSSLPNGAINSYPCLSSTVIIEYRRR